MPTTEEHSSHSNSQSHRQNDHPLLRAIITGAGAIGTALIGIFFSYLIIRQSLSHEISPQNWFVRIEDRHYAALIGTPMSAMTAFCIVSILRVTNGAIEFEAFGVTFRGASGPIILWAVCFGAVVAAFRILWWCQ
jgi:hypothetical protein